MSKRDYYEILGISKTATEIEIKRAYRTLAVKHHPDKNPDNPAAEENFKEAAEAYSVLSDAQKRAAYDRFGHGGAGGQGFGFDPQGFSNIEDIFDLFGFGDMFGGGRAGGGRSRTSAQRGADLRYDLEISLEEAAAGKEQKLQIPRLEKCDECEGKGTEEGTTAETCVSCGGSGQTRYQQGFFSVMRTCPNCAGKGQIIKNPCKNCKGAGRIEKERTIEIKIPAGVETGSRLRVMSEGEAGLNGGPTGDLYIVIHVAEHEMFERQGTNLYASVPVSFAQAALGAEIRGENFRRRTASENSRRNADRNGFSSERTGNAELGRTRKRRYVRCRFARYAEKLTKEQRKIFEQLAEIEDIEFQDESFIDKVRNIFG